jgi:hypothetical protein
MKAHDDLRSAYLDELRIARTEVTAWWDALLLAEPANSGDAYASVRRRWPAGPASHPRVIAVYRKYYLACEALNDDLEEQRRNQPNAAGWGEADPEGISIVDPAALLLELEAIDIELHAFINRLVFSPIGTDLDGRAA